MSLWIDQKYLKQISYRLEGFKESKLNPYLAMARCPRCGDSKKNKRKRRGGFFERGPNIFYKCMNCMSDEVMHFSQFLKEFDPALHNVYKLETFKDSTQSTYRVVESDKSQDLLLRTSITDFMLSQKSAYFFNGTTKISDLPDHNIAKKYLLDRKIPNNFIEKLAYTDTFFKWASGNTDRFEINLEYEDHPRIIIPWYNTANEVFAYSARSLLGQDPKYYMIVLDHTYPKFFGLERLDFKGKIYVVEGPVDSMFIPNCVAVGSAALTTFEDKHKDVVYIWDNEKRNSDVVKLMMKAARSDKKIFIPPDTYKPKDINDAILTGMKVDDIMDIIQRNTYQGVPAIMRMNKWRRIDERKV